MGNETIPEIGLKLHRMILLRKPEIKQGLHQPSVDIESTFHSNGAIKEQFVVIKNYKNEVVKSLSGDKEIKILLCKILEYKKAMFQTI